MFILNYLMPAVHVSAKSDDGHDWEVTVTDTFNGNSHTSKMKSALFAVCLHIAAHIDGDTIYSSEDYPVITSEEMPIRWIP